MSLAGELAAFRAAHPTRTVRSGGLQWRYIAAGNGDPVLVLGGALGRAEFLFQVIGDLAKDHRVIAPDYPPARSLDEATTALADVLSAAGVDRVHVVGGSFGGVLAQAFARRFPERVASLVLSHTGAPPARGRGGAVAVLRVLPGSWLRWMLRKRLVGTLAATDPFWRAQFSEAMDALTRDDIISRVQLAAAFAGPDAAPDGRGPLPYPVLILEADDDPLFTPAKRQALRAHYPNAAVHTFQGTGHAAALVDPAGYAVVVRRFLFSLTRPA